MQQFAPFIDPDAEDPFAPSKCWTDAGGDRNAGRDRGGEVKVRVMLLFVLYSVHFFFSLFFFSIVYSAATGRAGWNVMGPADAGGAATQHRTRGQAGGRGGRRAGGGGEQWRAES